MIRRRLVGLFDSFEKNDSTGSKSNELRSPLDWPLLDPFIKFENKLEVTRPGSDFSNKNVNFCFKIFNDIEIKFKVKIGI